MENAIHEMENEGVHSYILDLRNNPVILNSFLCNIDKVSKFLDFISYFIF